MEAIVFEVSVSLATLVYSEEPRIPTCYAITSNGLTLCSFTYLHMCSQLRRNCGRWCLANTVVRCIGFMMTAKLLEAEPFLNTKEHIIAM